MNTGAVDEAIAIIAERLGRNVSVDDPAGRVLAHHTVRPVVDQARIDSVLFRFPTPAVRDLEAAGSARREPFRLAPDHSAGYLGRVGVPLHSAGFRVGTVWIQPDGLDDDLAAIEADLPALADPLRQIATLIGLSGDRVNFGRAIDPSVIGRLRSTVAEAELTAHLRDRVGGRARIHAFVPFRDAEVRHSGPYRERILNQAVLTAVSGLRPEFVGGADADLAVLILPEAADEALVERLRREIEHSCAELLIGGRLIVAASGPWPVDQPPAPALRQAVVTAAASAVDERVDPRWERLGIYRLLASGSDLSDAGRLARITADRDAPELLRTLEEMLDAGGSKAELAERLHVHRSTLYGRLHRIERLVGANPLDPEVRLELHVALKAMRWARRPFRELSL